MAGGGGKGGSTSTEVSIPAWLEQAAQSGLARGTQAAGIGYAPYIGPDVAALTPMQEAAMFNTGQAASAFGLGPSPIPSAGMPEVQTFAGGARGYSAFPLYNQAVNELQMRDPAQYAKLMAPFDGNGQFGITSMPMGGMGPQSYGQPMREGPPQGSAASRNTSFDTYSTPASAAARAAANRPAPRSTSTSQAVSTSRAAAASKAAPKSTTKPAEKKTSSAPSRGGVGRR